MNFQQIYKDLKKKILPHFFIKNISNINQKHILLNSKKNEFLSNNGVIQILLDQ